MSAEKTLRPLDELVHRCLHCGLCLPVCPTYNLTNQEQSSPRGRIRLIKSLQEGTLDVTERFVEEMYFCLDCQACQTACPAGVEYGTLVEDARNIIAGKKKEPVSFRLLKLAFLTGILSSKSRTKFAAKLLRIYQSTGLRDAMNDSGILGLFSERLQQKQLLLPIISEDFFDESVPEVLSPERTRRGRVAFLSGCIMNVAFADVHHDSVEVLLRNGFEVVIPKLQQCCGSLHGHYGDIESAKTLARRNIDVFEKYQFDALIVNSAGCSAFMKSYGHLLSQDTRYAARAEALSKKVKDISEFLVEVGYDIPERPFSKHITYHEACHLVHTQKISEQPRQILQSIPGVKFVELPEATWCCGSAGIYNIVHFDDSMKLLDRKMQHLASTNADIVVTGNPGCHLQLQCGIRKHSLRMRVMHPASVLNAAYGNEQLH